MLMIHVEARVTLRRDAAKPWFRRRGRLDRRPGVPGGRPGGQEQRQDRRFSVGSGGSPGYDSGLRTENGKSQLVATEAGGTYTFPELGEDLQAAGFADVAVLRRDEWMDSVIRARKGSTGPTVARSGD